VTRWRRIQEIRFPDDLPIVCGWLTGVLVCAAFLAPVIAESALGWPSSTAGIGYFVVPILGLLTGGAAFLIAKGVRWAAGRAGVRSVLVPTWIVVSVLLAAVAAVAVFAVNARSQAIAVEAALRPRVIVESTRFTRVDPKAAGVDSRVKAPLLFSVYPGAVVPSIDRNGREVRLSGADEHVTILDKAGTIIASTDLRAFDYIATIHAVPVYGSQNGGRHLAVFVTLRATSRRSMLILHGPDGAVAYQEHLERTWSADRSTGTMYVQPNGNHDMLVVDHGSVSAWTCAA
jgi:hypothetical protein